MPLAPAIPCRRRPCPALVRGGGFCPTHKAERQRLQDAADHRRADHAFYASVRWRRLRKAILARDPICKLCDVEASEHADHIQERVSHPELQWDMGNLRGACGSCHSKRTAEDRRRGDGGRWGGRARLARHG